jgi:precorrin-6B methylase 1
MPEGKIIVAGIGPGSEKDITPAVIEAIRMSDVIVGYKYYFQFIENSIKSSAQCIDTGMKKERERAEEAFRYAGEGKTVCVISSGDAGIYGMVPLVYEMKKERGSSIEIEVVPGISAFQKAATFNAPTALMELCELIRKGKATPSGIVAAPVGFVNVRESKHMTKPFKDIPKLIVEGRKGGSNLAATLVNSILTFDDAEQLKPGRDV